MLKLYKPPRLIPEEQEEVILNFAEARIARLAANAINFTLEFVKQNKRTPSEEEKEKILKEVLG